MNGLLQRIGWTGPLVWAVAAALALAVGMHRARRAHEAGDELAAVTIVGIATLLASPVSWIHHAVWILPATGVLLGDGSDRARRIAWAATVALFLTDLPLLVTTGIRLPSVVAAATGNGFVLAYWALLLGLPITPALEIAEMEPLRYASRPVAARA